MSVSRGYTNQRAQRRYRTHFTCPPERELLGFLAACLTGLAQYHARALAIGRAALSFKGGRSGSL